MKNDLAEEKPLYTFLSRKEREFHGARARAKSGGVHGTTRASL